MTRIASAIQRQRHNQIFGAAEVSLFGKRDDNATTYWHVGGVRQYRWVYVGMGVRNWYRLIERGYVPKGTVVTPILDVAKQYGPKVIQCSLIPYTALDVIPYRKRVFTIERDIPYLTPNKYLSRKFHPEDGVFFFTRL
jgi:hypothetical protein